MGPIEARISSLIESHFNPQYFKIWNESSFHHAPPGSESHFKIVIISESFKDLNRVKRHQSVYKCLESIFKEGLHALALKTHTPDEWNSMSDEEKEFPSVGHH